MSYLLVDGVAVGDKSDLPDVVDVPASGAVDVRLQGGSDRLDRFRDGRSQLFLDDDRVGKTDLGPDNGGKVKTGKKGICFKVRLDQAWGADSNWGLYEPAFARTLDSQTQCCVECEVGDSLTIHVKFDPTTVDAQEGHKDGDYIELGSGDEVYVWPVTYTYEKGGAAQTSEEASEEASEEVSEEASEEASEEVSEKVSEEVSQESVDTATSTVTKDGDATTGPATDKDGNASTVATGDTTSAIALVAVVIASLGAAVVMTKKASKE